MDWGKEESKERSRQQERTNEGGNRPNRSRANENECVCFYKRFNQEKNERVVGDFCRFCAFVKGRVRRSLPYKIFHTYPRMERRAGRVQKHSVAGRRSGWVYSGGARQANIRVTKDESVGARLVPGGLAPRASLAD